MVSSTWPGRKDKDRDGDDGLLRPNTHESSRSRGPSESSGLSAGTRKSSVGDALESTSQASQQVPRSAEDLEQAKTKRKHGEE